MKTILLLLSSVISLHAQNVLVNFHPNNEPYPGLTNWPALVQPVTSNGIAAGWITNMTIAQYAAHRAALFPIYQAGVSNEQAQVKAALDADVAQLVTSYSNLQWTANNWASVTNVATLRVAVKACGDVLLKLKPVLIRLQQ